MKLIKILLNKIKYFFRKKTNPLSSTEEIHWINHIYDETVSWPNKGMMWANVHGFDEGPGQTYWVGIDIRSFGFRAADYIIKCKNKSTYDKWIDKAFRDMEGILNALKNDPSLNIKHGDDVEIKFIFKWNDNDKSFNVRFSTDYYAEEK